MRKMCFVCGEGIRVAWMRKDRLDKMIVERAERCTNAAPAATEDRRDLHRAAVHRGRTCMSLEKGTASDDLREQLREANFLAGFVRDINETLELESLYVTAARCLYDHLRYGLIVFLPSADEIEGTSKAFASVSLDPCADEVSELLQGFKGLGLDDIEGYERLGLESPEPGGVLNKSVCLDLPEDMGRIALFWGKETCHRISEAFIRNVGTGFSVALRNARKFKSLKEMSMRDALTGLFNRRVFEEMLVMEGQRREPVPLAMVLIDLDDFKKVNDTFGHQAGDMVLSGFGEFLRKNCRGAELVARYGGEEFAILLTTHSLAEVSGFVERLTRGLAGTTFMAMGNSIKVTVSIGIAHSPGTGRCDVRELLRRADLALYRAKNTGKNRACVADDHSVPQVNPIKGQLKGKTRPASVFAAL